MRSIKLSVLACCFLTPAFAGELRFVANPADRGSIAPELAASETGAILTWIEPEGDGHRLRFAEFDGRSFDAARTIAATGAGASTRDARWFVNWADTPRLFITPDGDWIAHWLAKSGEATYAYDVVVSRSTDRGASWSPPTSPHRDGTPTEHGFVSYFADPDGTAHLVWLDGRYTGGGGHDDDDDKRDDDRHDDRHDNRRDKHHDDHNDGSHGSGSMTLRTASMVGASFGPSLELDGRVCDCCQTASAMTDAGPVVVYRDRSENEIRDISIVRRTDTGWTEPAPVAVDGWKIAGCPVNGPDIVADGEHVAAAWFTMANDEPAVRLAISHDAGASFEAAQTFSAGTALGRVQLARRDDGFLMLWMDQADAGAALRLARFDDAGEMHWTRTVTELGADRSSGFPRMAVIGDQLLLAWTSSEPDASGHPLPRITTALFDLEFTPPG